MHAPRPHRSIPSIKTPPEDTNLLNPMRGAYSSPVAHLQGTRKRCVRHGRHDHIRQDSIGKRKAFGGAKDMLAKGRNGAYIPTGQMERRQMEATSPWIAPMDPFQPTNMSDVLMGGVDACPDCSQEFEIRRREVYQQQGADAGGASSAGRPAVYRNVGGSSQTAKRPKVEEMHHLYAPASHMHSTELGNAMDPDPLAMPFVRLGNQRDVAYGNVPPGGEYGYGPSGHTGRYQPTGPLPRRDEDSQYVQSSVLDEQDFSHASHSAHNQPAQPSVKQKQSPRSSNTSQTTDHTDNLVVTKKLTGGLNAVIVEHEGRLRRVVLNKRSDVSEVERLQRLSRELASVSNAIAFASAAKDKQGNRSPPRYSVVLDKVPTPKAKDSTPRTSRTSSSIPELLSVIDQAAGEIHLNSTKAADQYVSHRCESLAATVEHERSLANNGEFANSGGPQGTLFDMPDPGEQMAHRMGMEQAMSAAREQMAGMKVATRGRAFSSLGTEELGEPMKQTVEGTESLADVHGPAISTSPAAPVSRFSRQVKPVKAANQTAQDDVRNKVPSTASISASTSSTKPRKSVPTVITTKPAELASSPTTDEPIFATPPPISVLPSADPQPKPLYTPAATPITIKPVDDHPSSAAAAPSTPRALDTTPQPHSYFPLPTIPTPHFPNLLSFNPFHLRTPQPSSSDNDDSGEPIDPLIAASKTLAPPAITTQASPYSHAPTQPRDLYFAQHADPAVKERAQVIRAAMRMEKTKVAQEAAALERETRRLRRESAVAVASAGAGAGAVPNGGAGNRVDGGRKGWFG